MASPGFLFIPDSGNVFPGMERHVVVLSSTKLISVFAKCGWLQVSEVSSN